MDEKNMSHESARKPRFKLGQMVVPHRFKTTKDVLWVPHMNDLVGKAGKITDVSNVGFYAVHGWWWPEGALAPCYETKAEMDKAMAEASKDKAPGYGSDIPIRTVSDRPFKTEEEMREFIELTKKVLDPSNAPVVLHADPQRKTLGDFMVAALTGVCANQGYNTRSEEDLAEYAREYARKAFELYEKEGRP